MESGARGGSFCRSTAIAARVRKPRSLKEDDKDRNSGRFPTSPQAPGGSVAMALQGQQTPHRRPPDHAPWNLQTASANPQPVCRQLQCKRGLPVGAPVGTQPSNDAAYLADAAACLHHPRRRREARGSRGEVAKTPSKPRRVAHLTPDLTARRRRVACSSITHTLHPAPTQPTSGPQARAHMHMHMCMHMCM